MQNTALATNAVNAQQELILANYAMVRSVAYRIHKRLPRQVEVDDLISAGVLGLIAACDRYDASRSVPFETYARHRVRGAIVDALRAMDWVPRSVRRKADQLDNTRRTLRLHSGRRPTRNEMVGAMEISGDKYDTMVRDAEIRTLFSLDQPLSDESGTPLVEQISNDDDFLSDMESDQLKGQVIEAIRTLPDRERTTVAMYYLKETPLKEIGKVLGVTESRACQLRSQGVKRLRYRLRNVEA
jgi:RNA polymerase sigma factor FliA